MSKKNTERAFETYVAEILLTRGRWKSGTNAEWDKERALFPAQVFAFIQDTQPKLWSEMQTLHAAGLEPLLLTALVKELDAKGSLHVLRHGERPGHRARIHRTGHEPGLREREAD